jgi:dihydrodipicolinate reductase
MSKKTLRYGVVGAGRMGRHHIRLGTQLEGVDLVGIVDREESRRNEMTQTFGGKGFATVDELIAHGVDCVVIATPTVHHRAAAEALLAKGVHCLIEKPLAPSVVEARAIANAAAKSVRLIDYKVRILDSANGTSAQIRVLITFQGGGHVWTTVGASTNIIDASWHALSDSLEYALVKLVEAPAATSSTLA